MRHGHSPRPGRHLRALLGAARPRLRPRRDPAVADTRADRKGHPSIWRYAELLPVGAPEEPRLAPGLTPLVDAPQLAEALGVRELRLKLDTANPTHSFKDRVVAVAAAKAQEVGLDTLACSSTGNLAGAVAARAAAEGMAAAVFCPLGLEREKLSPSPPTARRSTRYGEATTTAAG